MVQITKIGMHIKINDGIGGKDYTTKLIDDFENVLAALIGLKNNENYHFVSE